MNIDEFLLEMDLNDNPRPNSLRDRGKKSSNTYTNSFEDKKYDNNKFQQQDHSEFDSILNSGDSPLNYPIKRRPESAQLDEQKKQKMADLFDLKKPDIPVVVPPPVNVPTDDTEFYAGIPSRRQNMRRVSQKPNTVVKSEINQSMDHTNHQLHEQEKISIQSDSFSKTVIPPPKQMDIQTQNQSGKINELENQINSLKQEKITLQENLEKEKNEKSKIQAELEQERRDRLKLVQDKMDQERNLDEKYRKEKNQLKDDLERDKQRAIESMKIENEILRNQLNEQKQLDALTNKINDNAKDLESLKNQLLQNHQLQVQEKMRSFDKQQQQLQDRENELQKERSYINSEKQRFQTLQDDISRREQQFQNSLEGERQSLKHEKQLLQEIKDSLKQLELDTKRRLESDQLALQRQKDEFDVMKNEVSSQNLLRQRQIENERSTFEQEKSQYRDFTHKNNDIFKQKFDDIERQQQKNGQLEMKLLSRQRELDLKENQIQSMHSELQRKIALLDQERQQVLQKLKDLSDKEQLYHKEINGVQEFRQVYQNEKETMQQQKYEISKQNAQNQQEKIQIEQEKQQLTIMHKTLSNLRSDIAQTNTQMFSQTAQQLQPKIPRQKVEKPKQDFNNNSHASNFSVQQYTNYLKNVDYLQKTAF